MSNVLELLYKASQSQHVASDLMGRVLGLQYAVVANNSDPEGLHRVQVLEPAKGARSTSDWLYRLSPMSGIHLVLPQVGSTVLVGYIDGDPHNGCYLGSLVNQLNPPSHQGDRVHLMLGSSVVEVTSNTIKLSIGSTTLELSDGSLSINGLTNGTINGKQIVTIDALDDRGHRIVNKGW